MKLTGINQYATGFVGKRLDRKRKFYARVRFHDKTTGQETVRVNQSFARQYQADAWLISNLTSVLKAQ